MKKHIYEVKAAEAVKEAADFIKRGNVILFPTETSYAIGADATNVNAIERIREIKQRSVDKPISIIVDSLNTMKWYTELDQDAVKLADAFMPGPLTLIVEKKPVLPNTLSGKTVAFRISKHPFAQQLCKEVRVPITATSANRSGEEASYDITSEEEIVKEVDAVFDAGKLPKKPASTIYDTLENVIVRKGIITQKQIEEALRG